MNEKMEALVTANEYMNNLKNGVNMLVNYIQGGEENKGISLIPDIADGISWVVEVMKLTKDVHKQEIDVLMIDEKLNEVVEAIENEDFILVGDLFEYEILPILADIHEKINKVVLN